MGKERLPEGRLLCKVFLCKVFHWNRAVIRQPCFLSNAGCPARSYPAHRCLHSRHSPWSMPIPLQALCFPYNKIPGHNHLSLSLSKLRFFNDILRAMADSDHICIHNISPKKFLSVRFLRMDKWAGCSKEP